MDKEYLTVKEAAEALSITEQTVRNYTYLGRLESEKKYNSTVISKKEVERYLKDLKGEANDNNRTS